MSSPEFELICAPVTPIDDRDELDLAATRRSFAWLRDAGVTRALVPGTTGEFVTLSDAERARVLELALDVFGPQGVIAHIGAESSHHARALAADAIRLGATEFSAITPYYFPAGPHALTSYYTDLREAVGAHRLYAYVFSDRTGVVVPPPVLARLAASGSVDGVKLSGVPTRTVPDYQAVVPDGFRVYSGNDADLFELADAGAAGVVSGVSSVFPRPFVDAIGTLRRQGARAEAVEELQAAVAAVSFGDISALKLAGSVQGLMSPAVRAAVEPLSEEARGALLQYLSRPAPVAV
ncbi:dihydrodipicolinate synthase family protein [Propionicimonas sp.]|uniref:dihydrodipicolinate synthase family protein n=1 Tax=Propionicimonas sp. TaxID=1955623 RepID=UPI0039E66DFD